MFGEMVRKKVRARFCLSCTYSCTVFVVENFIVEVKEPLYSTWLNVNHGKTR